MPGPSIRTTVSLPNGEYEEICRIAAAQRVSAAWVLRDAVREYLARRYPLLEHGGSVAAGAVNTSRRKKKSA